MDDYFEPTGLGATIFRDRYARNEEESWLEACRRVSDHVAQAEENGNIKRYSDRFFNQLAKGKFCPGGRIWYGSGRPKAQLGNCYVLTVSDSREGWGKTTNDTIIISGLMGGIGMNVSPVRPRGYQVKGTGGYATGAVSFMQLINGVGDVIVGGGGRRMALMLGLEVNHPDIEEFLHVKLDLNQLNNANVSIIIPPDMPTEDFIHKVLNNEDIELVFNGVPSGKSINARQLWDQLVENAWTSGEPGVLNSHYANKMSNIYYESMLTCTNPSMPAGTLVGTRDGIFPIEELENKRFEVKSLDGDWAPAKCFMSGEDEEILEINLGSNKITYSTKQHRWPVLGRLGRIDKVYADELMPGDLIPLNRNELTGMTGDLSLTEEDGFFVGYLLGDGWISQRETGEYALGIVFSSDDLSAAERIKAYLAINKDTVSNITERRPGEYYLQTTNQPFIHWVIDKFGFDINKEHIPSKVWKSNDEFVIGFIDGWYSSDGSVSKSNIKNPLITLTSSRKGLALDISKLLSFYGISSTITHSTNTAYFPNNKDYERTYERWDVRIGAGSIVNFLNVFSISQINKAERLSQIQATREFRSSAQSKFARVVSVKSVGRARVWDISVEHDQHVFPSQYVYTGNCGEIFMSPYDMCVLGALVLPRFINNGEFDWDAFDESVRLAVRYLDNVVSVNHYPLPEIKDTCERLRRLGLGVMGLHTMLLNLGMKYDSEEAFAFVDKLFNVLKNTAYDASINLAIEKGPFPAYDSQYLEAGFIKTLKRGLRNKIKEHGIRNCAIMTVAPTGTTSMVMGVSSAIEPLPPAVYWRNYYKPTNNGSRELATELVVEEAYYKYPDLIQSAVDISIESHFRMQKVVQTHVDNAVSKTINMPKDFPKDQFGDIWLQYLPYLKGTTVYRYGSRQNEPINPVPKEMWEELVADHQAAQEMTEEEFMSTACVSGACDLPQPMLV